ncbi:hypothetical protein MKEN_01119400 [Mycena kentingensis (nom. inval.)]|nr:hypothetical protein MKEN_01119400 [Mycena kentingensis (nom. inval.)]
MSKHERALSNAKSSNKGLKRIASIAIATGILLACFYRQGWTSCAQLPPKGGPGSVIWLPKELCRAETECGSVIVPKDYFDESTGTASIAFAVKRATKLPRKGSVFTNPGGPGASGTVLASRQIQQLIGDEYDIVGFDPRGINRTSPQVACFESMSATNIFTANTVLEKGFTLSTSNISDPSVRAAVRTELVAQASEFLAVKQAQADVCARSMGDDLKYMGTANVVRDMDFMAQVFDGQGAKINYWGGSYGSIIGSYLANMLPHRVGYVAIDGIVDPVAWTTEPSHPHEPYTAIQSRIESFFDTLARTPLPVVGSAVNRPGILTSGAARGLLLLYLEQPVRWAESARAFAGAMKGNGTLLHNKLTERFSARAERHPHSDLTRLAVQCLDSPPPSKEYPAPSAEDLADELLRTMERVSTHFGASMSIGEPDGGCQFWPTAGRGPERFVGPWNASLDVPMLIVSNTMDPITPIQSGLLVNSLMPNSSILIIQDGPGHGSPAVPTPCIESLVRGYFTGTMPKNGTVCATEYDYFPKQEPNTCAEMGQSTFFAEERLQMSLGLGKYCMQRAMS